MLPQVVIRAVGDAFELLPVALTEREAVLDVHAAFGVMGQLVIVVHAHPEVRRT